MNYILNAAKIAILCILILSQIAEADTLKRKEIKQAEKIYQLKCVPCHGQAGEGIIGPAIGCHGVKNKSDRFLFETIYYGRKGDHGTDMPSWGTGDPFEDLKEVNDFRKILKSSKKFSSAQIDEFVTKIYGEQFNLPVREKKEQELVRQLGYLNPHEINLLVRYLRYLEKKQEKDMPSECIADKTYLFKGDTEEGKKIFGDACAKCHGKDGRGESFFAEKDVVPRDFSDRLYMNSKTDAYLKAVIKSGGLKQGRSAVMAPVPLSDKSIEDVITYIRTLSR